MSESDIIKTYNEGINSIVVLVKGLTQTINELNNKISSARDCVNFLDMNLLMAKYLANKFLNEILLKIKEEN